MWAKAVCGLELCVLGIRWIRVTLDRGRWRWSRRSVRVYSRLRTRVIDMVGLMRPKLLVIYGAPRRLANMVVLYDR